MIKVIREKYHRVRLGDLEVGQHCKDKPDGPLQIKESWHNNSCSAIENRMVIPCGPNGELPDGALVECVIRDEVSYFYAKEMKLVLKREHFVPCPETEGIKVLASGIKTECFESRIILCRISFWFSAPFTLHWAPVRGVSK